MNGAGVGFAENKNCSTKKYIYMRDKTFSDSKSETVRTSVEKVTRSLPDYKIMRYYQEQHQGKKKNATIARAGVMKVFPNKATVLRRFVAQGAS